MKNPIARIAALILGALVASVALTGCGTPSTGGPKIALLLPESKTARYEAFDRPYFEQRIAELGDYDVLYSNADQDAAKQQSQAEAALASGQRCWCSIPSTRLRRRASSPQPTRRAFP